MKNMHLIFTTTLLSCLLFGAGAQALTITDVGGEDTFLDSTTLANSGDAFEEAWVESVLGFDVTLDASYDSGAPDWQLIDGTTDVYASMLTTDPLYFLLKIGTGGTTLDSHYLFQNVGDLSWAVVDFSDVGIDFSVQNISIDRMSHVGEFDGTSVPEPATLLLLGLGLIGLGLQRWRTESRMHQ